MARKGAGGKRSSQVAQDKLNTSAGNANQNDFEEDFHEDIGTPSKFLVI